MGAHGGGELVGCSQCDVDVAAALVADVAREAEIGRGADAVPLADVGHGDGVAAEADAGAAKGRESREAMTSARANW